MTTLVVGLLCWRYKVGGGTYYARTLFDIPAHVREDSEHVTLVRIPEHGKEPEQVMTLADYRALR